MISAAPEPQSAKQENAVLEKVYIPPASISKLTSVPYGAWQNSEMSLAFYFYKDKSPHYCPLQDQEETYIQFIALLISSYKMDWSLAFHDAIWSLPI